MYQVRALFFPDYMGTAAKKGAAAPPGYMTFAASSSVNADADEAEEDFDFSSPRARVAARAKKEANVPPGCRMFKVRGQQVIAHVGPQGGLGTRRKVADVQGLPRLCVTARNLCLDTECR